MNEEKIEKHIETIFSKLNDLAINTAVLISPGSLAFSNENKFGVKIKEKTFKDFYKLFRDLRYSKSMHACFPEIWGKKDSNIC